MPPTAHPRWECFRKHAYATEKIAKAVARDVRAKRGAEVHAYSCTHCGAWHLGKNTGRYAA